MTFLHGVRTVMLAIAMVGGPTSGAIGIYGIVEKVVFEPNEESPERVQVWGAFAYVDGGLDAASSVSEARKGYLYFKLPDVTLGVFGLKDVVVIKREWDDLKSIAGTGQAVGFGYWGYIGDFNGLKPDVLNFNPPYIIELEPGRGRSTDMRVRPASESPKAPATYRTNVGIVKLTDGGSHANIVKMLKVALSR